MDYDAPATLVLDEPAQLKALGDPLRTRIVTLLMERAATTTELATALDRPVGTVAHHVNVLADAGLVTVVRTRQVRAVTEKFFGRTARLFLLHGTDPAFEGSYAAEVMDEARATMVVDADAGLRPLGDLAYARVPAERATEFHERLKDLLKEFREEGPAGDQQWGILAVVFPTAQAPLPRTAGEDAS